MNFESKLNCKDFHKAKKLDNHKIKLQQKAFLKDESKIKQHMRAIKNNYRKDIKMIKAGSYTFEDIQRREEAEKEDEDGEEEEKVDVSKKKERETPSKKIIQKRNFSSAFDAANENEEDEEPVKSIFVYDILRPDDYSKDC